MKEFKTKTYKIDQQQYWNDYEYGQVKEKLKIGREVKGNSGGNTNIGYFTFNSTGNRSITGVGFKPSLVRFTFSDNSSGMGTGAMTPTYQFAYDMNSKTQIQSQCIYIRNSGGSVIGRAVFVSMDSGGFTINVTFATTTIYVNYECFG